MNKCVIIGSGLGGLTCGLILQRNGYDVTIVEQGSRIGGCLQCFTRSGGKFETGMHFIGSALPGQTLYKLLRFFGLDELPMHQLDTSAYEISSIAGQKFRFANGREAFIEQMASYFPDEKDNLNRYFEAIETVAAASSLNSLRHAESDYAINTRYQTVSVNSVIDSIFNDRMLRQVLVSNLPLYAGKRDKTPFSQHAFITNFYNQSAFRFIGGSDSVATKLASQILDNGGQILTQSKATKIICDSHRATAVELNGERIIPADIVIAAIHPARVMEMIAECKLIRPAFRRRITALPNTMGCFSLFLKFKPESVPYLNSNFYSFTGSTPWGCEEYTDSDWPKAYMYMHFCHDHAPRHASTGVMLSYMNIDDVRQWENTQIGHRGDTYEDFKRCKAATMIAALEKDFPGISTSIESYYTASPLTYSGYTGTQDGSMYGVEKNISLGAAGRVPHRTKLPNLLLAGQNINSHGILGVIVGTIVTCSELLTAEKIYQQIIEANNR